MVKNNMNIKYFKDFFDSYVDKYIDEAKANNDEKALANYMSKKVHTYNVVENILQIANMENLDVDMEIVELLGLFHDIGRFEQFRKYRTFNDAISCNHAKMSIKVLEDERIIHKLDYEIRKYLVDPILMHNLKDLPRFDDKKMYYYTALIRDADKLDNFRAVSEIKDKYLANFKGKMSEEPEIADEIVEKILESKSIYKYDLKTKLESQVVVLGYISSDINYKSTIKIIDEKKYVDRMFKNFEDTPKSRKIYEFVKEYVRRRIADD